MCKLRLYSLSYKRQKRWSTVVEVGEIGAEALRGTERGTGQQLQAGRSPPNGHNASHQPLTPAMMSLIVVAHMKRWRSTEP